LDIVKEELVAVHKSSLSRREFVALTSGLPLIGLPSAVAAGSAALTADQVVAAIRQAVEASGVTWSSQTVDTFKAGNPSTVVTGIVTTALATFEVLHRAVLTRANLIVTIEPTFHIRSDSPDSSTVAAAKLQFIEDNGLVVWRFSDHWPQVTPNPLAKGLVEAMGWNWGNVHGDPPRLVIPTVGGGRGAGRIRLAALSAQIKNRLKVTGMRVVGLPSTPVTTVGLLPGTTGLSDTRALTPDVDVIDRQTDPRETKNVYDDPTYARTREQLRGELNRLRTELRVPAEDAQESKTGANGRVGRGGRGGGL
jgi:hypothetical protein